MKRVLGFALLFLAAASLAQDLPNGKLVKLTGMQLPGSVTREANDIPHVFAFNKHDMYFLNGWLHAQDRLFQMDVTRRAAAGTLAELVGQAGLSQDVQLRTLGLYRAAQATLPTLSADATTALQAYSDGVNAYASTHALPPEYALLNLTKFAPWTPTDTLAVGKILAWNLSFDTADIDRTIALLTYQGTGKVVGFNGTTLFGETWRSAPFAHAATIPDATGPGLPVPDSKVATDINFDWLKPETLGMAKDYADAIAPVQAFAFALAGGIRNGSNEWAVAPKNSTTGFAMVANDPHLSLAFPSTFYPIALQSGRTKVAGMGFPGAPAVIQGQNTRIAWGSTVHPMDVTDIYQEQLVPDASSPSGLSSIYNGAKEPVVAIPETFRMNAMTTASDTIVTVAPTATNGIPPATLIVKRHGPIIKFDPATGSALSVQHTGFYPTHELEAFMLLDDAQNVDQFKAALQYFDFGSQNFAYADVDGNIAYFTSAEMPVREDLQANKVNGAPPYFIRNGEGGNEWMAVKNPQPQQAMPFEILPYSEMPQVTNPSNGWFVNANNDPIGQTFDNDPLNMQRPGGGIYYLSPGYDSVRASRITQMMRAKLANGGKIAPADMQAMQADSVLLDAEVFVPYITKALANAQASSDPTLKALAASPAIQGAIAYLAKWDFSTPTGLTSGYDAGKSAGTAPTQTQLDDSVAATIYAAWRGKFVGNTLDTVLNAMKLPLPPDEQSLAVLRTQLENYSTTGGTGAAGVNFFNVPTVTDAATRRDILILASVKDALTMLTSADFAPAFGQSTNLADYNWGKLHRIVFAHPLSALLSPGAPFGQLPLPSLLNLPGVARQGGWDTVDAATHSIRAKSVNGFMFAHGPNRRYVGVMDPSKGPQGQSSLPGGVSGIPGDPHSTDLLMQWLIDATYPVVNALSPDIPWLK